MSSGTDKAIFRLNDAIMAINYKRAIERDPKVHIGLNPLLIPMRHELHVLNTMLRFTRKRNLRNLLVEDNLREETELRYINKAYTNLVN